MLPILLILDYLKRVQLAKGGQSKGEQNYLIERRGISDNRSGILIPKRIKINMWNVDNRALLRTLRPILTQPTERGRTEILRVISVVFSFALGCSAEDPINSWSLVVILYQAVSHSSA